jgi:hypothetical protein
MSYIVSGADDRTIKIWKMNGTKAYEVRSCLFVRLFC